MRLDYTQCVFRYFCLVSGNTLIRLSIRKKDDPEVCNSLNNYKIHKIVTLANICLAKLIVSIETLCRSAIHTYVVHNLVVQSLSLCL